MDALIATIEQASLKKNLPDFRVGDILRVHQRIREGGKERIQVFEGIIIAKKHGRGMAGTFTVRRIASGIGVERVFPLHSPLIAKIERIRSSKVRRAKLYFLRGRVGKKAKLKGWEAYASWEEKPDTAEMATEASEEEKPEAPEETLSEEGEAETEVVEVPTKTATDEQAVTAETAPKGLESDKGPAAEKAGNDAGEIDNGANRRESSDQAPPEEGPQDSGEKPQE